MRRAIQFGLIALLLGPGHLAAVQPQSPDLEGQPTQLRQGAVESYWVWHDGEGYHVRTTTAHDRHAFTGYVEIVRGGVWVKPYELRPDDVVRLTGNRIEFRLSTQRNLSGFDLRLDWSSDATLHLELDGRGGNKILDKIFVGSENSHPTSNPIALTQ